MTVEALTGVPVLRQIPTTERIVPAVGPMPWLTSTGRLEQVLMAWGRRHLAEVPAGLGFDVLLTPSAVAEDTVRRMGEAGHRVGPVILEPSGGEFILERGSAPRWTAPRSTLLVPGTLVLLPPPTVCYPETVSARGWLVPPVYQETGALLCADVTPGGALLEPYLAAVQAAKDAEALGSAGGQ